MDREEYKRMEVKNLLIDNSDMAFDSVELVESCFGRGYIDHGSILEIESSL